MATKLKNLVLDRIDLVDKGANQHAHVTLFKRLKAFVKGELSDNEIRTRVETAAQDKWVTDGEENRYHVYLIDRVGTDAIVCRYGKTYKVPFAISDTGDVTFTGDGTEVAVSYAPLTKQEPHVSKTDNKQSLLKALGDLLGITKSDPLTAMKAQHAELGKGVEKLGDITKLASDHPGHLLKSAYDALGKAIAEAEQGDGEPKPAAEPDVNKSVDPAIAKRFEDLEKRAADAEAANKVLLEKAQSAEVTTILKSFAGVPVKVAGDDSDVQMFATLKAEKPDVFKRLVEILNGADAQIKDAQLFGKALGSDAATGTGSAWAQIEAKAGELMKADTTLTRQAAIDKASRQNPQLVAKHREERN